MDGFRGDTVVGTIAAIHDRRPAVALHTALGGPSGSSSAATIPRLPGLLVDTAAAWLVARG